MSLIPLARLAAASLALFAASLAFGQAPEPVLVAANTAKAPVARPAAPAEQNVSLLARIEDQQRQIDELKAIVGRLQAKVIGMSEPVAAIRPILPPVALSPTPAPAPAPAPANAIAAPVYRTPRELLPDIGHIGAQVGLLLGGGTNPFKNNNGLATGGFIDLPWKNVGKGKLSYEIMIGLQRSKTTQSTTSGVNVLANAVVNSYLGNTASNATSLTSYLAGPLPITSSGVESAKVLTVAPVLLKYAANNMGRFRPYVVGGLGMYVWIGSNDNSSTFNAASALGGLANAPVGGSTLGATLNALLQGSQIGGLAPTAPELAARGIPHGQGNLLFGAQFGGGFELRVAPKVSIGIDIRRNQLEGKNSSFTTFAFKQGLHW